MENNASKRPDRSAGVIINPLDLMDYKPMRENKPNSFVLFENKDKTGRQPDFKGSFYDESGKQWDIAGWMNTSMKGTNYIRKSRKLNPVSSMFRVKTAQSLRSNDL